MSKEKYVLATGEDAEYRLQIVNSVHGSDSENFLRRAGLREGLKVAEIGCGVGVMACWIAEQIGGGGRVFGVDISAAQVQQATKRAERLGLSQAQFSAATADKTELEYGTFDLVYSRFMLMHVQDADAALREMARLLKPGGMLAVEDGDFLSPFCYPPSRAYDRVFELYHGFGERHGEDFAIGQKLYKLVYELGLSDVSVELAQPLITHGDAKRLPEWTLIEAAQELIALGLTTQAEIDSVTAELATLAADPSVAFGMARVMQVVGRKSGS